MASPFAELKRRNVLRTAALYLAGAWLLLQVADLVFEAFGAPPAAMRWLISLAAVGFPLVLLLSWVYQSTGSGLVRDHGDQPAGGPQGSSRPVNAAIAVLAILAAGIFAYSQYRSSAASATGEHPLAPSPGAEPTIAVLPLKNISADPEDAWFADGLTEELLNVLASVPQLQVTARASSFALRDEGLDAVALGERLGVGHILDGSVRRQGSAVRVSVRLVRTSNGTPLWSAAYDRELTDIFEIQEDIAQRVSGTLQLSLLGDPDPIVRRTTPEAYSTYLRALSMYRERNPDAYGQVAAEVERALELDSDYAPAWTLLASVRQNQGIIGALDHGEAYGLALEAINRALAIDPNFAFAIASRAWLALTHERDLVGSARRFNRAIELAPNEPTILSNAAVLARQLGQVERAIELTRKSISLNPVAAAGFINLSDQLCHARRYEQSIEAANRALELSPGHPAAMVNLAVSHLLNDEAGEALRVAESIDMPFYREFLSGLAYFDLGRLAESDAALAAVIDGYAEQRASYVAAILAHRGEKDAAFKWLQRAIDEGQRILAVRTEPLYDKLHGDPRWRRILEQLNLSDAQVAGLEI